MSQQTILTWVLYGGVPAAILATFGALVGVYWRKLEARAAALQTSLFTTVGMIVWGIYQLIQAVGTDKLQLTGRGDEWYWAIVLVYMLAVYFCLVLAGATGTGLAAGAGAYLGRLGGRMQAVLGAGLGGFTGAIVLAYGLTRFLL